MPITSTEATAILSLVKTAMSMPDPKVFLPAIEAMITALSQPTSAPAVQVIGQIPTAKAVSVPSSPAPQVTPASTTTQPPAPTLSPAPIERKIQSKPTTAAEMAANITTDIPRPKKDKKRPTWADVQDLEPSPYVYTANPTGSGGSGSGSDDAGSQ